MIGDDCFGVVCGLAEVEAFVDCETNPNCIRVLLAPAAVLDGRRILFLGGEIGLLIPRDLGGVEHDVDPAGAEGTKDCASLDVIDGLL